jgi:poly-gamma-glutamate synthesis protein (capsule biosynthesis protein)
MLRKDARHLGLFVVASLAAAALLFGCADSVPLSQTADAMLAFDEAPSDPLRPQPSDAQEQAAAPEEDRALVSFAGDCTLSNIQGMSDFDAVHNAQGPAYFLGGVREVFANDDLTIVNLEGPLTTSTEQVDKGEPPVFWFRSPPEYVQILKDGGVEVCNLANNHTLDYGRAGFEETKETLASAGIDYFCYNDILVREVNGIRLGFFGFSFDSNADNIREVMDQLSAEGAEAVVAYFHDGIESQYSPSASQIAAAHAAIDYGAATVIMSHPHVIQGVEEYNGRFIAYSLGNFCYGGHTNPADKDSLIAQLEFTRGAEGITCTASLIPCSISSTPGTNDYRPMILADEEKERVMDKIAEISP